MKVSIVIPVYNRQELIRDCLDSVLAQSYPNWECIVVDDGSTDDTWQVLEEYSQKDVRIKIFNRNREPKGAPTCRNIGIDESVGEFLVFIDSDDLLAPWALEKRMDIFRMKPNLDIVLSNGVYFNSIKKSFLHYTTVVNCNAIIEHYRKFDMVLQTSAVTWSKIFMKDNNLTWDEELNSWQDTDLFIKGFSLYPNFQWTSELPNYFCRQENDEAAITSTKNFVSKTIENFTTFEKWLTVKENEIELREYFPTFMLFRIEHFMSNSEIKDLIKEIRPKLLKHFRKGVMLYLWLYRKTRNIPVFRGLTYSIHYFLTGAKKHGFGKRKKNLTPEILSSLEEKYLTYTGNNFYKTLWKEHIQLK